MSKKHHNKQLERARTKRRASKYDRRAARNKIVIIVMAGLMVVSLVAGSLALLFTGNDDPTVPDPGEDGFAEGPCPSAADQDVPEPTDVQYEEPPSFPVEDGVTYVATLQTTCGQIEVELDLDGTPRTAENFLALADEGFYDGVPFHRTIQGFMIQGGDPTGTGTGGPGYTFEGETGTAEAFEPYTPEQMPGYEEGDPAPDFGDAVGYPRGTIAMANTGDPDSQSSQFFIVQGDPSPLPPLYTAFGEVVAGMDVVDDIAAGAVGGQQNDEALDPVVITGVTIDER